VDPIVETTVTLWRLAESGPTSAELLSWGPFIEHEGQELAKLPWASTSGDSGASWPGYTWEPPGPKLRVKFADDTWVDVSWNARDGSGVTVHAVKPEAAYLERSEAEGPRRKGGKKKLHPFRYYGWRPRTPPRHSRPRETS
jgi:hypothetical protein